MAVVGVVCRAATSRHYLIVTASGGHDEIVEGDTLPLMTVSEVCEELGIARSTWEKWRARRVAPPAIVLPNGSLRVRRNELEDWLQDREVA